MLKIINVTVVHCPPVNSLSMVCQGLWTAFYGQHGPEILHLWFDETLQSHNGAPVFEGRNARPRLVGCKVTGDPNVPATQWSFVAQVTLLPPIGIAVFSRCCCCCALQCNAAW